MKKAVKWLIIGILTGAIATWLILGAIDVPLKKENKDLKAEISVMKEDYEVLKKTSNEQVESLLEQIGGLQGNIDSLMTISAELESELAASREDAAALEAHAGMLMKEVQPVLDANPKVRELVETLLAANAKKDDQIFTLEKEVVTWKSAFANSEKKYEAQVEIAGIERARREAVEALLQKVETRLSLQDRRVKILELRSGLTLGTAALAAVAAVLVATLLK